MNTIQHQIVSGDAVLYVEEQAGAEPPVVLMHGFPDDHHIYDNLMPALEGHRVIRFDFAGYGRSSRPSTATAHQLDDLMAVVNSLGLQSVTLVGHDASGPDAIDAVVRRPERFGRLILLNTYYGSVDGQRFPEMIHLLAEPRLQPLTDAIIADADQRLWLLAHTARQFGADPFDPQGVGVVSVLAQFFGDDHQPDSLEAIRAWTADLFPAIQRQDASIAAGDLSKVEVPVTVAFGVADPYLDAATMQHIASLFANVDVVKIDEAGHWPQWDQPASVAAVIGSAS